MANERIHLVPEGEVWKVKAENGENALAQAKSKEEAEKEGRRIAREKGAEFVIHNSDGTISDSDSFGNDPESSKDSIH